MTKGYKSEKARENILKTYDQLLARWGCEAAESDVPTPYGDTHVVCFGPKNAPALVLLHGVGDDTALMWLLNAKALAAHFCCYAIDTLGGPGKSRPESRAGKLAASVRMQYHRPGLRVAASGFKGSDA